MKNRKFIILFIFLIITLPYAYGGCVVVYSSGGIDREKKIDDGDSSRGFIGIISQATINPENAGHLTAGAFAGGLTGVEIQSSQLYQNSNSPQIDGFNPLRFLIVLGDSLRRIKFAPAQISFSRTDVIIENGNFEGSCGGDFSYTLNFNRVSERFSGNLSFTDYCDDGIIISGETDVDGSFELSSGDFDTATFLFDSLSDGSHTLDGEIAIDFSDTPILASFTAYSTDKHAGSVYWIKDYSMNLYELVGHIEIEIFGTFYHPDYGFVTLTTFDPFIVHDEDDWPTSGRLVIQGANDTTAQLTAIDRLRYRIEADTEGNGIFDWDSGIFNWND